MVPDNIDNHIKNKLEDRSINPSKNAWIKLSEKLDSLEDRTSNNSFWWLAVAASIVVVLLITIKGFDNNTKSVIPTVVDTEKNKEGQIEMTEEMIINNEVANEDVENQQMTDSKSELEKQPKEIINQLNEPSSNAKESIAQNKMASEPQLDDSQTVETTSLSFEDQKVQEVVAQIHKMKSSNDSVSEAEIDDLLKKAEKQIKLKRLYNENTKTVNANSLLEEVEADLERSFREKVLEALMSSYKTVKVAVAERND